VPSAGSGLCLPICFFFLSQLPFALRVLQHPQHHHWLRFQLAQDLVVVMSNWTRSNVSHEQLLHLVEVGQLPPLTDAVEWIVPADELVPRPLSGYVVSFVTFHERGFSIPVSRFIRGVLFAYGLQLQYLNPNNIQQMAAFEVMCEEYLGIGAHWPLFQYFFRFTCPRDGSRAATIGCANLRTKQGRDDDYIPVMLTSTNSGWHKGWFFLQNDREFALSSYTGCSIAKSQRNWSDGPAKKEQEKMLKLHWAVLGHLRNAGVTLAEVIGQYHARGVVPLRRRPLRLCDMTADRPPCVGTVTVLSPSSPLDVQSCAAQVIGRSSYSWPPSRLLPMFRNAGTKNL
jgi:hypothetical protein